MDATQEGLDGEIVRSEGRSLPPRQFLQGRDDDRCEVRGSGAETYSPVPG
jgi:hypothetical protein